MKEGKMEILRQAVKRDRGALVLVRSLKPTINWNTKSKSVTLKTESRKEGNSTYEYLIHLSVGDIQEIIGTLTNELLAVLGR